jgi:acyl carrier protein
MDENIIIADINKFIKTNILANDILLEADTNLQNTGIDSFSLVEIMLFIQQNYNILIPDNQLVPENFKTLQSLARLVNKLLV